MPEAQVMNPQEASPAYKLDVQLHELLMKPATRPAAPPPLIGAPQTLRYPHSQAVPTCKKGPTKITSPKTASGSMVQPKSCTPCAAGHFLT